MPEEITLADGTTREVPTQEELEEISSRSEERKKQREEAKQALAEAQSNLESTTEKLSKLENKDFNFKKLREMSKEEKEKLTTTEMELKQKQEELEENQKSFTKNLTDSQKNEALAVLVGDDEKIRKKVLLNYDRIVGDAKTKDEVFAKMRDAYNMLGASVQSPNPVYQALGASGGAPSASKQSAKVDSELARSLGVSSEDIKKYS